MRLFHVLDTLDVNVEHTNLALGLDRLDGSNTVHQQEEEEEDEEEETCGRMEHANPSNMHEYGSLTRQGIVVDSIKVYGSHDMVT